MAREGYEAAAEMVKKAESRLEAMGFTPSQSSLGDARYWTREGGAVRIRTATYHHRHDATVDLVITPERARQISLTEAELAEMVNQAMRIAERMESELAADDSDEANLDVANMTPEQVARALSTWFSAT